MATIKTYTELLTMSSFEERYKYLRLHGQIGKETFGFDRCLNQRFYHSQEWKSIRDFVIVRDNGCDLGVAGYEIYGKIVIHHLNPISIDDLASMNNYLLDPDYLICTSMDTHNAIHYGDDCLAAQAPIERTINDTCPWKH